MHALFSIYYTENGILLATKTLVETLFHYIRERSGVVTGKCRSKIECRGNLHARWRQNSVLMA